MRDLDGRSQKANRSPPGSETLTDPNSVAMAAGGEITGLIGLGMGEMANTVLGTKDHVSLNRSIGTSTLVLHVTVLAATLTNLALVYGGGVIGIEPKVP